MLQYLRSAFRRLKSETFTLYFAARDPRTPWYAKVYVGLVVAYALSPIDLIPDFIPVLGYLDEAILLPIAIWLGLKLLPAPVIADARTRAAALDLKKTRVWWGALLIAGVWICLTILCGVLIYRWVET